MAQVRHPSYIRPLAMRYALIFFPLAACLFVLALQTGGWGRLLLWPALSTALVAAGYAGMGAKVFGKRRDGRYAALALIVHLPYLLNTLLVWYLIRWAITENPGDEVAPGIWVARRPLHREVPPGVRWVVDVTAEFWVAPHVQAGRQYVCYPTLDGHVCDDATFDAIVREVAALEGGILIHCAKGHGRSAALAVAVLIARGVSANVEEAEQLLIAARPKVGLKASQRALVGRMAGRLQSAGSPAETSRS